MAGLHQARWRWLGPGLAIAAALILFRSNPWERPRHLVRTAQSREIAAEVAQPATERREPHYVGVQACRECHEDKVATFEKTSHYLAMQPPSPELLAALFDPPQEVVTRREPLHYELERRGDDFYQVSVEEFPEGERRIAQRIDLVMGSGKLAYAGMYWQDGKLYQMPLIYFPPLKKWVNAPGFSDRWPWWDRPINPRCLDCHSTYFQHEAGSENGYRPDGAVMEISCERCHGAASEHVAFQTTHPEATEARGIVHPRTLSRERHLEICAQCHSEVGELKGEAGDYQPGTPLADYLKATPSEGTRAFVHSVNQLQRLSQSKCFEQSQMTCISCHDPHVHERDDVAIFSQRCLSCHEPSGHAEAAAMGDRWKRNCIDCHMPRRDDESTPIQVATGDKLKLIQLRDHLVAIYPEDSQQVLALWKEQGEQAADSPIPSLAELAHQRVAAAFVQRASQWQAEGEWGKAVELLREGLKGGMSAPLARRLAWLLVASPDDAVRNAHEAAEWMARPELAADVSAGERLDLQAALAAEQGDFEQAVALAEQALNASRDAEDEELLAQITKRLAGYRESRPYRATTEDGR
jgi:hypothetical protein